MTRTRRQFRALLGIGAATLVLGSMACGSSQAPDSPPTTLPFDASDDGSLPPDESGPAEDSAPDVGRDGVDAAAEKPDEPAPEPPDGPPTRVACTGSFGSALTTDYGRMDGFLVAIVDPTSNHSCNGDTGHLHLQVKVAGSVYDVAININDQVNNANVYFAAVDSSVPGGWSEGWHTGVNLDYANNLHLNSSAFAPLAPAALSQQIKSELQTANHISVFGHGYGPDGMHDIHRNGTAYDGAIVIRPLSSLPHVLAFHFADQTF